MLIRVVKHKVKWHNIINNFSNSFYTCFQLNFFLLPTFKYLKKIKEGQQNILIVKTCQGKESSIPQVY